MDKKKLALAITKGLAYAENGGKPNFNAPQAGKSGEMKSIFQFTPDTWKGYSKEILGKDNVPLNNETESYVVHQKVSKWVDEGYSPEQIASMWNAGPGRPDAYKQNWRGTNKYGVDYDTPKYAQKVLTYTKQFYSGTPQTVEQNGLSVNSVDPQKEQVISKIKGLVGLEQPPVSLNTKKPGLMPGLVIDSQGSEPSKNGLSIT